MRDREEGRAIADRDLSTIDVGRLVWDPFGDDLRGDLFGGSGAPGTTAPTPAPAPLEPSEKEPLELVEEAGA